jgi:hypothetical protein
VGNFSKRNTLLAFEFVADGLANFVFGFCLVLHLTACPVCVNFDPEVLILLEEVVYFKGQVVLLIAQKDFEQLIVTHRPQLLEGYVAKQTLTKMADDTEQFGRLVDFVVIDLVRRQEGLAICGG